MKVKEKKKNPEDLHRREKSDWAKGEERRCNGNEEDRKEKDLLFLLTFSSDDNQKLDRQRKWKSENGEEIGFDENVDKCRKRGSSPFRLHLYLPNIMDILCQWFLSQQTRVSLFMNHLTHPLLLRCFKSTYQFPSIFLHYFSHMICI